jgi:hypothetical protein
MMFIHSPMYKSKADVHKSACMIFVHLLTIMDFEKSFQICEPVRKLPKCKYFRDVTWTLTTKKNDTLVNQVVNCICPKDSVAYMIKRQAFTESDDSIGFKYSFACSPQSVSHYKLLICDTILFLKKHNQIIQFECIFLFYNCRECYVKEKNLADYLLLRKDHPLWKSTQAHCVIVQGTLNVQVIIQMRQLYLENFMRKTCLGLFRVTVYSIQQF